LLRTFRLPGVTSANVAALLQFSAVIPVFFFVALYLQEVQRYSLQEVQRYSALRAGLAFLPLAGGVIVIAPSASWLVGRFGRAPTLIAGPLVFAGGLVYLSYLPVHATYVADVLPDLVMVAAVIPRCSKARRRIPMCSRLRAYGSASCFARFTPGG